MGLLEVVLLSFGLSLDSFSVAVCKGLEERSNKEKYLIILATMMSLFHIIMIVLGFYLGNLIGSIVNSIDHWVAFILLLIVGIGMIKGGLEKDEQFSIIKWFKHLFVRNKINMKELLLLSLATSIDAFAIGITFSFLEVNLWLSSLIIFIIIYIMIILGYVLGDKIGGKLSDKAELLGGIILIGIGLKILLEHLLG